jgi:aspartyl-tRNA(Asn)/glutamyl-tRNA(Gln) amidotransferase subunit A
MLIYEGCAVNRDLLDRHFDELDPAVASRIVLGRSFSAEDCAALLERRARLQERIAATLENIDALLVPTCMIPAAPLATIDESQEIYNSFNGKYNRNAGLGNYLNLCAVSVPCGITKTGLPIVRSASRSRRTLLCALRTLMNRQLTGIFGARISRGRGRRLTAACSRRKIRAADAGR